MPDMPDTCGYGPGAWADALLKTWSGIDDKMPINSGWVLLFIVVAGVGYPYFKAWRQGGKG